MNHTIIPGDCIDGMRTLPDASVHCCVTSPPYWGLRDYGHDGQIGLESTPEEYVARMVEVFREVRRVLRDDGTCWVNLGDSYSDVGRSHQKRAKDASGVVRPAVLKKCERCGNDFDGGISRRFCSPGCGGSDNSKRALRDGHLKHKDLVGIPWRVAFALQADGWWLRQDIIWHKPNPMPESVRDRCTKAHEYVFLLTKSERYYYDADAVSEASVEMTRPQSEKRRQQRMNRGVVVANGLGQTSKGVDGGAEVTHVMRSGERKNRRSVWTVTTKPYSGAHFAVMPPDLVEPCIKAGTSEEGCCPKCGAPWGRVVERTPMGKALSKRASEKRAAGLGTQCGGAMTSPPSTTTTGWHAACTCGGSPVPCTVLDPFAGSGTTLAVAAELGRNAIGCELNPEYITLAEERITKAIGRRPLLEFIT